VCDLRSFHRLSLEQQRRRGNCRLKKREGVLEEIARLRAAGNFFPTVIRVIVRPVAF